MKSSFFLAGNKKNYSFSKMISKHIIYIEGLPITVYDNKTVSKESVVFLHGNSLGAFSFFEQLQEPLLQKYRCITFDLPGHGDSGRSVNAFQDYNMPGIINFTRKIIGSLNLSMPILAGHSFGGHVLLEAMAGELKQQISGLAIFGSPPMAYPPVFEEMFFPVPEAGLIFKEMLEEQEIESLAAIFIKKGSAPFPEIKNAIRKTDPLFRKYLGESIISGNTIAENTILANLNIPVAIFHGIDDQLVNPAYYKKLSLQSLWRGSVHEVENAGHCIQMENAPAFNQSFSEFCEFVFSTLVRV